MQVLIVGSGGREHALAWKLAQSPSITHIYCAPGNGGMRQTPKCQLVPMSADDLEGLLRFATVQGIGLTVVGPEIPLVAGIVDRFQAARLPIFGPTQAAAQIEGSKAWAKALMQEAGIPTASYQVFEDKAAALVYLETQPLPVVVKADGLAAGKGVTVAQTLAEACEAVEGLFAASPGQSVVIESFLPGEEISVLALCDGEICRPLLPIQDHKRVGEQDTGANTGGMGAFGPVHRVVSPSQMAVIQAQILDPTLAALKQRGILYQGVLYAGLMISPDGDPVVLEFNCRFGDPETQVLMPLLDTPLEELLLACVQGRLESVNLKWRPGMAACVVMAAAGYPGSYERGKPIVGLEAATTTSDQLAIFHAGTRTVFPPMQLGRPTVPQLVTDGGRVLCLSGWGDSLSEALDRAYAGVKEVKFEGSHYRSDIGWRELAAQNLIPGSH
ncbi:MAG: phosphoribosylamine--glycine ligase [Synechococcaceae cyanobacterium SM2_3_2]|nr:phosphoribosylamine--glycine ligase [Synechococcaceae cyanobacterium SM2_3_2]